MKEETVTIHRNEYEDLKKAAFKLQCLENAGVDNWDWYDDAMEEFNKGGKLMKEAQHTQGRWVIGYKTVNAKGANIRAMDGTLIAELHDNCEAWNNNAFLIAAAPDLLEALESIQARVNGDFDHPALVGFGSLSHNIQADIALIATKAIEKAKGE